MATDLDFMEFLADQMAEAGEISFRKMFGEYAVYCHGKVVALVCDNQLFVKPTPGGRAYIGAPEEAPPYPGAKDYFLIANAFEDREWLAGLYGSEIAKSVRRTHATRWNDEPLALGAFSAAPPGAQPLRRVLMEGVRDRLFFAGEAAHETLWGTVGGAWESGERAADAALKLFRPAARSSGTPARPRTSPRPRDGG